MTMFIGISTVRKVTVKSSVNAVAIATKEYKFVNIFDLLTVHSKNQLCLYYMSTL